MAWNSAKPDANDDLDYSVNDIQGNFAALESMFTPGSPKVNLAKLTTDPTAIANTLQFYVKSDGTNPQVYIQRESGSADTPTKINLTGGIKANPGWCVLPCGIMLVWGSTSTSNAATSTKAYAFQFPTACLAIVQSAQTLPSGNDQDYQLALTVVDKTNYTEKRHSSNHGTQFTYQYLAIGY